MTPISLVANLATCIATLALSVIISLGNMFCDVQTYGRAHRSNWWLRFVTFFYRVFNRVHLKYFFVVSSYPKVVIKITRGYMILVDPLSGALEKIIFCAVCTAFRHMLCTYSRLNSPLLIKLTNMTYGIFWSVYWGIDLVFFSIDFSSKCT